MNIVEYIHGGYVFGRRARRLCDHLAELIPPNACVLDVGSGDGFLASMIHERRSDTVLRGIDVLARPNAGIPVELFDGSTIPFPDASFDVVMLVDVIHHAEEAMTLLQEAVRVSRQMILIKDLTLKGFLASSTLRFMDWVGNRRHGVALPYDYWTEERWEEVFQGLQLKVLDWKSELGLYPWPTNHVFDRSFHFVARLHRPDPRSREPGAAATRLPS
jgi:SAM-dependent methyltransferase